MGQTSIIELFGDAQIFPFPKPMKFVEKFLQIATMAEGDDVVLDFFAGSGTTGHAVENLNRKMVVADRYILVQLPEPTGRKDFPTIAEITKERVRRVIKKLNDEDAGKLALEGGAKPDRGFKIFKLDASNFRVWNPAQIPHGDTEALKKQLELHVEHIVEGRMEADLLYEILLKSGFPLTTPVEKLASGGQDRSLHR